MVLEKKEGVRGQGEKNLGMRTHSALASTGDKAVAIPEVIPYIKTALRCLLLLLGYILKSSELKIVSQWFCVMMLCSPLPLGSSYPAIGPLVCLCYSSSPSFLLLSLFVISPIFVSLSLIFFVANTRISLFPISFHS